MCLPAARCTYTKKRIYHQKLAKHISFQKHQIQSGQYMSDIFDQSQPRPQ